MSPPESLSFRPCRPDDVEAAVPLIYSSGPDAFDYVFCASEAGQSLAFLRKAFVEGHSEFGYQQHIAAVLNDRVVAVGAVRYAEQSIGFTAAAASLIFRFYPLRAICGVMLRGLKTETVIRPPARQVAVIYQLGVAPEVQGRGIGRQLVAELLREIRKTERRVIALDVAVENHRAQGLYRSMGFTTYAERPSTLKSNWGFVPAHLHMQMRL